ncbi:hypothetical protein HY637_00780 [Candidatus Woesearchaeota archaeon]|nr:hypothetical protein [Candidatus Woesearchaeota archaeon]
MRSISKDKYLMAGAITVGIFLLGLFLGLAIEGKRVNYIESVSRKQNLEFSSLQLQYAFIDQLSQEKNCLAVQKTFEQNINSLESTRIRLENFDRDATLNKNELDILKNEYLLAQIRYWLLAERTRELCGSDIVSVLYFFSDEEECPDCEKQAFVLTYLKKRFKDRLLIFSFDSKFEEEPMIPLLKNTYDTKKFPTIVIEGKPKPGFQSKESILKEICTYYREKPEDCIKNGSS